MINIPSGLFLASVVYFLTHYTIQLFRLSKWHSTDAEDEDEGISVIVCARNEYNNLQKLVPLLLAQTYVNKEIIIIDDRSQDDTYDYLLSLRPKVKLVRVEHVPNHANGKKYGLTLGIKAASHDRLVFTDADCWPSSDLWLSRIAKAFDKNTSFVIGYSQYARSEGLLNLFVRFETLMTGLLYLPKAIVNKPYMGIGRNLAYRKSLFMEVKGFGQKLNVTGGDDDLFVNAHARKRLTKVDIGPEALILSHPKNTWSSFFTQKKRHLSVGRYYKSSDKMRMGFHSLSQITFWLTFIILALAGAPWQIILAGFLVKMIMQAWLMVYTTRKTGDKFDFWLLPMLDFSYSLYIVVMGTIATFSKRVKWS
jgi:glycosyltransferase involved in cell wall biosynthesis